MSALRRTFSGVRARVLLLVLLALVPALAVVLISADEQRAQAAGGVRRGTTSLVRIAATDHEERIRYGHRLLEGLAVLPEIRDVDAARCRELLSAVLRGNPHLISLGVMRPDGMVLCSTRDLPPGYRASAPGLAAVREAWERRDFAVSEYTVGPVSGRPMLALAHAVPGAAEPQVVFASLSLDWFGEFASTLSLPEGSTLTVTDLRGTVLARFPEPARWVGTSEAGEVLFQSAARSAGDTSFVARGPDGTERFYSAIPLQDRNGNTYGYASIGVPTRTVYEAENRIVSRNLLWLAIATALAGLAAWWGGNLFFARPIGRLLTATERLKSGDRSARSGTAAAVGELALLGRAFDEMAESLQQREEELERTTAVLRRQALVFDTLHEGVLITDPEGRIIDWNPGAERLFGYSREEALGRPPSFYYDPKVARTREAEIAATVASTGRWSGEIPFVRRDGTRGVSEVVVVAQVDAEGRRIADVAVHRDVTDRRRSEAALRESELSYRMLFNSLTELVYIQDLEGRFLNVNDAVVEAYGYSREELLGATPALLADPERVDVERVFEAFRRATEGELQRFEFWGRRKDGESFPKEVVLSKATYFGREVVIAVARDITERKIAEEALRRSEDQLRHAQKMEAVGRLAGGIAHDFNNLLMAIRGNVELALLELPPDSPLREDMQQVQQAADTASSLTRQLLAFSRKRAIDPRPVDVNEVVRATGRLLERLIGPEVEVALDLGPDLWPVKADQGQLEQVVMNLALNARDAMPEGGRLSIATANRRLHRDDPIRPSYVDPGEFVELVLRDTGHGMDAHVRQHVFEPFFTTKEKEKGTGLGLFTVYGIVRGFGGAIWVESEPGQGTTFHIVFPRAVSPTPAPDASEEPESAGTRSETILLVEDEEAVRKLTRRMLERIGYTVLEAPDGTGALRVSEEHPTPIHLLLTDMTMPQMSGRELARRMVEARPEVRVVYMSGYTEETVTGAANGGPPGAFLHKPFTASVLARTVRDTLDS